MEIIIAIVLIVAVTAAMLYAGSRDNAKPISSWSDEKLLRMHGKLGRASTAQVNAGMTVENLKKAGEYLAQRTDVEQEIQRRKQKYNDQQINDLADQMAPAIKDVTAQVTQMAMPVFKEQLQMNLMRMLEANQKVMQEDSVTFEEAKAITRARQEQVAKGFIAQGMTQEQADAASMKEVFNIDPL